MKANYLVTLSSMLLLFITGFLNSDWEYLIYLQSILLVYPLYTLVIMCISMVNSFKRARQYKK